MKRTYLLLLTLILFGTLQAQDQSGIPFGRITEKDFISLNSPVIDSNANAIIIFNIGSIHFEGSKRRNWVNYVYKIHKRIKIVSKKAITNPGNDISIINILLQGYGKDLDLIDSLEASTFNLDNGHVIETKLTNTDIYQDKINGGNVERKFALPAVKEGSIIEYSYRVISSHIGDLPDWHFQYFDFPCLYSDLDITIPNLLVYSFVKHGVDTFQVNESTKLKKQLYKMASVDVTTEAVRHHWVMKNIPAFRSEDFISSPENYLDKLEFQLAQVYNGEDIHNLSNNWKTLTENLLEDDHFGLAINQEGGSFLFDDTKNITRNDKAQKDQARSIYNYIKNNFESVGDYDIKIRNTLMSVYSKKKGSDAELNLLLIAMLRQKGIRADPVILGTRNMGPNPSAYPVLNKINHVICAAWIAGDTLFLDASSKNASFDRLPIECYNGHARIISSTDTCSVYFYTDAIKEREMTTVFISNAADKKLSGTFEQIPGLYASDEVREKVKKTGIKKYFDFAKISFGSDGEVKNPEIDSLKTQDFPVRIYYEFTTNSGDNNSLFYFNPFVNDMYNQNPFKEEIRKYPVELRYPLDEMYVLNMEIPEGYVLEDIPKSAKVAFNGNEGFYEYMIAHDENNIQLRSHLKLNRANYAPEEYNTLRDFFAYIVKKQSEQIVFKKK